MSYGFATARKPVRVWKLTDRHGVSGHGYRLTKWSVGHTVTVGAGADVPPDSDDYGTYYGLCSEYWLHTYRNPLVALFCNEEHGKFKRPLVWEVEAWGPWSDDGSKVGFTNVRPVAVHRDAPVPSNKALVLACQLLTHRLFDSYDPSYELAKRVRYRWRESYGGGLVAELMRSNATVREQARVLAVAEQCCAWALAFASRGV